MKMKIVVNRALVPMKAHYFLWNAGTGSIVPYLSLYARQLGFSSVVVGFIYTILPIFGMIAKPSFGALADRFHCQKAFFLTSQLLTAAAFLAIFYSPKIDLAVPAQFSCQSTGTVFSTNVIDDDIIGRIKANSDIATCQFQCNSSLEEFCTNWELGCLSNSAEFTARVPLNATTNTSSLVEFYISEIVGSTSICPTTPIQSTCNVSCSNDDINSLFKKESIEDDVAYNTYQFWIFLLLMVTSWMGQAIAVSLGDAICFEMLGDKPNRYGYQRCFGALGWGLLSLITGLIVGELSRGKTYIDYTFGFYLAAGILIVDFIVSSRLNYVQTKFSANIFKDVGKLLMNIRIIVFLMWCIAVGMCTGLIWQFFLWLVGDLAKARGETHITALQATLMGVQCLGGELPFFFLSGRILRKIGHVYAMSIVLLTLGIRFVLYSVIDNPWYYIPIEFSNGLTFGLFYACMASYASIIAPSGTEATMQGLVGAVFEGVGVSFGSLTAGIAIQGVDLSLTFRYFGFAALGACALHFLIQHLLGPADPLVVERSPKLETFRYFKGQLTAVDPLLIKR